MIWEGILFHNEVDMLRMHLGTMAPVVDRFVIVEGAYTFSGQKKPQLNFIANQALYAEWLNKIDYLVVDLPPNSNRWVNEHRQRDYIGTGLDKAAPDDIVLISDADEIANPEFVGNISYHSSGPVAFDTWTYYYYLDYMMEPQEPTSCKCIVMGRKRDMHTPQSFRDLRLSVTSVKAGWHFSYLGGVKAIQEKISAFSHSEYDQDYYKDPQHLNVAMASRRDLFDRGNIGFRNVPISYPTHPHWLINHLQDYLKYLSNVPDLPARNV
jgi:beta-1,4-mannosyl-glycoprotein beta-1,4-N-acetylglucosaminyltransferase